MKDFPTPAVEKISSGCEKGWEVARQGTEKKTKSKYWCVSLEGREGEGREETLGDACQSESRGELGLIPEASLWGKQKDSSFPFCFFYSSWPYTQALWITLCKEEKSRCNVQADGPSKASQDCHPLQYGRRNEALISATTQWGRHSTRGMSRYESATTEGNERWSRKQLPACTNNQESEGETDSRMDASPERWQVRSECSATPCSPHPPPHALHLQKPGLMKNFFPLFHGITFGYGKITLWTGKP